MSCLGEKTSLKETIGCQYMEVKYMWKLICKKGGPIQWKGLDAKVSELIEGYKD